MRSRQQQQQHRKWTADECARFFLWVRVRGPELFAGRAAAASPEAVAAAGHRCVWRYAFRPSVAGRYRVDAKIVQYHGNRPRTAATTCAVNRTTTADDVGRRRLQRFVDDHPIHAGWKGFKLYDPVKGCCEMCARQEGCVGWSSPPFAIPPSQLGYVTNGCELYYSPNMDVDRIPRSHLHGNLSASLMEELRHRPNASLVQPGVEYVFGTPYRRTGPAGNSSTMWFAGCGWSNWFTLDFPCVSGELDDMVYLSGNSFDVVDKNNSTAAAASAAVAVASESPSPWEIEPTLPLCELDEELDPSGRWVRGPVPPDCDAELSFDPNRRKFGVVEWNGTKPHCWHRDDLSRIGHHCIEMNCGLIKPESRYISPLKKEASVWYGKWMPYRCRYREWTDAELQTCIDAKRIVSFNPEGASISEFLHEYVSQRIEFVKPFNVSTAAAPEEGNKRGTFSILSTKKLLHLLFYLDEELEEEIAKFPNVTEDQEFFVVGGFFLSSERDTYAEVERVRWASDRIKTELGPKGYKYLDAYDLSAAFTYDTATQMDGMHIIGPPMKALITKYFHYLCKDVIQ